MSKEQIDAKIKQWFAPNGPGRLEVIARARHHELRKLVTERMSETAQSDAFANLQLELTKDANLPASTIETAKNPIIIISITAPRSGQSKLRGENFCKFIKLRCLWLPEKN
jgi:hypothetical protein